MKFTDQLRRAERRNDSLLCVGLDPDPAKFPGTWKGDAARIFDFCAAIVDATKDLVIAFKPQIAYFAGHRAEDQLERLMAHIKRVAPEVPVILDAKRGDIGATAEQYAREAFERYQADAVTLSPFMGFDSIEPWLRYGDKGLILLCRTSNPGGSDLQAQPLAGGELLYERVARLAQGDWNRSGQLGLVVGATFPGEIARVRELAPTLPLLIPGAGRRWRGHGARRLACRCEHRRQLVACGAVCVEWRRFRERRPPRRPGHPPRAERAQARRLRSRPGARQSFSSPSARSACCTAGRADTRVIHARSCGKSDSGMPRRLLQFTIVKP
jgi:orotidine-5'-phosphate decarboxylase